jgi:hypothetical protein
MMETELPQADDRQSDRTTGREQVLSLIPKHGVCAEIGSWKGRFAAAILRAAAPTELHLVDPWRFDPSVPDRWYGGSLAKSQADMDAICERVRKRFRASPAVRLCRAPSLEGAARFADHYFDWVYIDGDHSYEAVLADLNAWYPKVKPGGQLACDDYRWRDDQGRLAVKLAIDDFLASRAGTGLRAEAFGTSQVVIYVA